MANSDFKENIRIKLIEQIRRNVLKLESLLVVKHVQIFMESHQYASVCPCLGVVHPQDDWLGDLHPGIVSLVVAF